MVTPQDVVNKARSFIGQSRSDGSDGNHPPDHPWAFWCEAFVEMVHEQLGLTRVRRNSALAHALALDLTAGAAPAGAMVFFGTAFFPEDGHVAISLGDGTCVGTVTDGTGVDIRPLNQTTTGYLGWAFHRGVQLGRTRDQRGESRNAARDSAPSAGWYRADTISNIRPQPGRDPAPIGSLTPGTVAAFGESREGESVDGDPWWLPLRHRPGFVHRSLLTPVCPPPGRYRVDDTSNIRPLPGRGAPPVGTLAPGTAADYGAGQAGAPVGNNPWWLPLEDGRGWVHSSVLVAV